MKIKTTKTSLQAALLAGSLFVGSSIASQAAVIILAYETGSDVVFTYSGSLDLTGATKTDITTNSFDGISPSQGLFLNRSTNMDRYEWSSSAGAFGPGGLAFGAVATGDAFVVQGFLCVEDGYVSGNSIAGTLTYTGTTLGTLGVDFSGGDHVWTMAGSSDTVTLTTPEPSSTALLGLGALGLMLRRKRR
jgi:hypothetical protein